MKFESAKITSEFDRSFQNLTDSHFLTTAMPLSEHSDHPHQNAFSKDSLTSFYAIAFTQSYYTPFCQWAYEHKNIDFIKFYKKRVFETVPFIWKTLKELIKVLLLHIVALPFSLTHFSKRSSQTTIFFLKGFESFLTKDNSPLLDLLISYSKFPINQEGYQIIVNANKDETFIYNGITFKIVAGMTQNAVYSISLWNLALSFKRTFEATSQFLSKLKSSPYLIDYDDFFIRAPFLAHAYKQNCQEIFLTNSNCHMPPLWVYYNLAGHSTISCMWYSASFYNTCFKDKPMLTSSPHFAFFHVDKHYYWGLCQLEIKKINHFNAIYEEVTPTILHKNSKMIFSKPLDVKIISLFNPIPYQKKHMRKFGIPEEYINNFSRIGKFLADVCEVVEEIRTEKNLNIKVLLKNKRSQNVDHEQDYFKLVTELEESGKLQTIDPSIDMESLICNTDISISHPYSTPYFLSKKLNQKSLIYDCTDQLLPIPEISPEDFIGQREELKKKILELL